MHLRKATCRSLPNLLRKEASNGAYRAYTVIKREGKDDYWLNPGACFPHEDGEGFNLLLQAMPADKKIVLRRYKENPERYSRRLFLIAGSYPATALLLDHLLASASHPMSSSVSRRSFFISISIFYHAFDESVGRLPRRAPASSSLRSPEPAERFPPSGSRSHGAKRMVSFQFPLLTSTRGDERSFCAKAKRPSTSSRAARLGSDCAGAPAGTSAEDLS